MNCICNLIDNEIFWVILIALAVIYCTNNSCGGCDRGYGRGCPCS